MQTQNNVRTTSIEVATIKDAMAFNYGNQRGMAEHLGINRGTLAKKLASNRDYYVRVHRDGWNKITHLEWLNK